MWTECRFLLTAEKRKKQKCKIVNDVRLQAVGLTGSRLKSSHVCVLTMSWVWPFLWEPLPSPFPSSLRSTTRHFTAS